MTVSSILATDLLTPLGAYLHLRENGRGRASCSSRSSRGGSGATPRRLRLAAATYEEAELPGEPVVGYLGYDFIAKLEPTVPLPDDGPGPPGEPLVVADARPVRPAAGVAEVLHGDAAR